MKPLKQYNFILGNNPELSRAEILAVLARNNIRHKELNIGNSEQFLKVEAEEFVGDEIIDQLGGTIKIGEVLGNNFDSEIIIRQIKNNKKDGKVKFGFSWYGVKPNREAGMTIKNRLKEAGINSRLVVSRVDELSSVIVKKNKCLDFLIGRDFLGLTVAVQDFERYGEVDYGRPRSDSRSGMLPPKVAKMIINLAQIENDSIILDPFCGSGTILTMAVLLGYKNLIGSDIAAKAVEATKENLEWIINKFKMQNNESQINSKFKIQNSKNYGLQINLFQTDVLFLSKALNEKASVVITEPYLGPALRGRPKMDEVDKIKGELQGLYLAAFKQFNLILSDGGKVVIVFPEWHIFNETINLGIESQVTGLGFTRLDDNTLIYKRAEQKVWRKITIWSKR